MLKSNSKKAAENIRAYIMDNFTPEGYTDTPPESWTETAAFIMDTFRAEKYSRPEDRRYYNNNEYLAFADWCARLPSLLDTRYFYNRSAVDDLGAILEQTETEKSRFTEEDADNKLTYLIYRELAKGAKK